MSSDPLPCHLSIISCNQTDCPLSSYRVPCNLSTFLLSPSGVLAYHGLLYVVGGAGGMVDNPNKDTWTLPPSTSTGRTYADGK